MCVCKFSTSGVGGVEARSFLGAVVRDVGRGFLRVAVEDRLGEEGRRLMPLFFGCVMVLQQRVLVMHAIRATRVRAREVDGVPSCHSGALAAQEPQSSRHPMARGGAVRRKGCRGVK